MCQGQRDSPIPGGLAPVTCSSELACKEDLLCPQHYSQMSHSFASLYDNRPRPVPSISILDWHITTLIDLSCVPPSHAHTQIGLKVITWPGSHMTPKQQTKTPSPRASTARMGKEAFLLGGLGSGTTLGNPVKKNKLPPRVLELI